MAYAVLATPEFDKDYRKLSPDAADRIAQRIESLAADPSPVKHHPLKYLPESLKGLCKLRIGDYRLLYWIDHVRREMVLYAIAHRREVYRRLGRG